jgi:small subunit ribosomal protein S20
MRSDARKHTRNKSTVSRLKTLVKRFDLYLKKGEKEQAKKLLPTLSSALDKAAQKGIIHKNNASRRKSRLVKKLAA